jgi:hypothetical protein
MKMIANVVHHVVRMEQNLLRVLRVQSGLMLSLQMEQQQHQLQHRNV